MTKVSLTGDFEMSDELKTDAERIELLQKIVNDATAAFLVTRSRDAMHGRPMATAEVDDDFDSIWFACQRDSTIAEEVAQDGHVFLGYTNGSGSEWASINGHATLVDSREKIKDLWQPIWKNWFEGPEDPKIILIQVSPEHAEYWDSGSRVVQLLKFAVAAVSGKHVDEGEHGEVELGRHFSEDGAKSH
jgi:general stress protein 26